MKIFKLRSAWMVVVQSRCITLLTCTPFPGNRPNIVSTPQYKQDESYRKTTSQTIIESLSVHQKIDFFFFLNKWRLGYFHICQWLIPISSYSLFNLHVSSQPKCNFSRGKGSACEKYLTKKLMNLINKNAYIYYSLYLSKHILLTAGDTRKVCIPLPLTSVKLIYTIDWECNVVIKQWN